MILGLDVGGTQTDAVLIHNGEVVFTSKTPTQPDLLDTLRIALGRMVTECSPADLDRMSFSTTMVTNAIVQDRLADAGMIISAGPGMDPHGFSVGPCYEVVQGCLDHRGFEVLAPDKREILEAATRIKSQKIQSVGIVGKFSVRNPVHEFLIGEWIQDDFSYLALGHQVSGLLNFPRRITTTYLNAALQGLHHRFKDSLMGILQEMGLTSPKYLLKPDGGTVKLESGLNNPAQTAQSGPAASVMGALALDGCPGTTLVLDIGGTTTDIAVVIDGVPLLEPFGIRLGPYQTLIRSLLTHSMGIGGDSAVKVSNDGELRIGPLREGTPMAFGGPVPTPTDAMVFLGMLREGDPEAAKTAMEKIGTSLGWDVPRTAQGILERMGSLIADSALSFVEYLNSRPVYTIHEVLHEQKIEPDSAVIIGGPADCMARFVEQALGIPCRVPPHFGVANAVGAAVARVTAEVTLQADTERRTAIIPEADVQKEIFGRFNLEDAQKLAEKVLRDRAEKVGADPADLEISIMERQVFTMIRGYSKTGQNIRLKMGITPGLIPEWKRKP